MINDKHTLEYLQACATDTVKQLAMALGIYALPITLYWIFIG